MIQLAQIAAFLDRFFAVERYADDQGGVYLPSARGVRRIGLALEPWPRLPEWVEQHRMDALFLHRPWRLDRGSIDPTIGVLAYHLAFDERLTLGYNDRLAAVLAMPHFEVLGTKEGRPLGMIGDVPPLPFAQYTEMLHEIFGGLDFVQAGPQSEVRRLAVVGSMTDALVREAAAHGADVYVTGQFRQPARAAVLETGIGVLEVGHRRSEQWGLRALAGVLRERWARLDVLLPDG